MISFCAEETKASQVSGSLIPLLLLYRCRKLFSVGPDVTEIDKRARLSLPHTDSDYVKFIRRWLKGEIIPPTKYEDPSFYYVLTNLTNQIKEGMKNVTSLNGEGSATNLQLKQPSEFPTSGSLFTPEINARTWLVPTTKDERSFSFLLSLFKGNIDGHIYWL